MVGTLTLPCDSTEGVSKMPVYEVYADNIGRVLKTESQLLARKTYNEYIRLSGVICHESGCPNMGARYDSMSEEWVKQYTCRECGCKCDEGYNCCTIEFEDTTEYFEDEE